MGRGIDTRMKSFMFDLLVSSSLSLSLLGVTWSTGQSESYLFYSHMLHYGGVLTSA